MFLMFLNIQHLRIYKRLISGIYGLTKWKDYTNVEEYLNIHFHLLREDLIDTFRIAFNKYQEKKVNPLY